MDAQANAITSPDATWDPHRFSGDVETNQPVIVTEKLFNALHYQLSLLFITIVSYSRNPYLA